MMEMKRIIVFSIIALIIVSCSSEERYVIKGKIKDSDGITFYLRARKDGVFTNIDSAVSKKGSFAMKGGAIEYPQTVSIVAGSANKMVSFYLENSTISIHGSLDSLFKADITGSKTNDEYKSYIESNKSLSEAYQSLNAAYIETMKVGDSDHITMIRSRIDSAGKEMIKNQKEFVVNNPASFVTPAFLTGLSGSLEVNELESYINNLDAVVSDLPPVKILKEKVAAMHAVEIGKKAPDFTMNDVDGKPVSLSSKIGTKLLLFDFWAAWCEPYRDDSPNTVKTYNEFHKKGFDILGVSLDNNKEDWLKAIKDDKLAWTHVSELDSRNNSAATLYVVNTIPSNFLLDEQGIIIGKNLRGEDLYDKVKEILEEK